MPELVEHNAERGHDSDDDDSTQPPPLLDRRLEPESDSESEYETGKSQMTMEELSATVEAIVTPKPSTEVPEWIKAFMMPDADSDKEDEDIEQLMLTKQRLEKAPEHLKQIPIVDMINCDVESYQNEIYDEIRGVVQNGNNVDIIMNGDTESTNPARDLCRASHARPESRSFHSSLI